MRTLERSPAARWTSAPWLIGLGLAIGLLDVARVYAGNLLHVGEASWWRAFAGTFPYWGTFGVVLAPFAAAVRRFPVEREGWRRALVIHFGLAFLFVACHHVLVGGVVDSLARGRLTFSARDQVRRLLNPTPMMDFLSYAALVGAVSAFAYHRRFVEEERALVQARLETLRMQLNPHFLFNTLNATSVLALKGEGKKVAAMLTRLSDLLRVVLDSQAQVVPLADEVALLERYLEIERVRFEDRLTVLVEIDPAALGVQVPSLSLQPLAENAIRHGVSRRPGPGRVEVRGRLAAGKLVVEVEDSGPGFQDAADARSWGVGLANTRARLEQIYGGEARMELSQAPAGGGLVRLTIPHA